MDSELTEYTFIEHTEYYIKNSLTYADIHINEY